MAPNDSNADVALSSGGQKRAIVIDKHNEYSSFHKRQGSNLKLRYVSKIFWTDIPILFPLFSSKNNKNHNKGFNWVSFHRPCKRKGNPLWKISAWLKLFQYRDGFCMKIGWVFLVYQIRLCSPQENTYCPRVAIFAIGPILPWSISVFERTLKIIE